MTTVCCYLIILHYVKKNRLQSRKKYQEKANYEGIKKLLPGVDWKLTLQRKDVQAQWDTFDDIIKHYVKEYVPSCMVEKNRDSKYNELFPEYIRQKSRKNIIHRNDSWRLGYKKHT